MTGVFLLVVIAVGAVGVIGALVAALTGRRTWEEYGRSGLSLDSDAPAPRSGATPPSGRGTAADRLEQEAEIRQMLGARNARRARRGEPPLDVEAELARLAAPAPAPERTIDPELRAEIRQLVLARNARRARRGEPPLDVEAEVARQIRGLSG